MDSQDTTVASSTDLPPDMSDHDKSNLLFLMNADNETLKNWYMSASKDDVLYAQELFLRASIHFTNQKMKNPNTTWDLPLSEMKEANAYLSKFRLNHSKD